MTLKQIPRPEHPRPDRQRISWQNLNGEWAFDFAKQVGDSLPAIENLKKTINVPFTWTCPLSGVAADQKGAAWYARTFTAQKKTNARLFLCIGAADYWTTVYINGAEVGRHQGGYGEFEFEVTAAVADGENMLMIRVEDNDEDYQTRGKQGYGEIRGIWQTIWLEERPLTYIERMQIITRVDGEASFTLSIDSPVRAEMPLELQFGENAKRTLNVVVPEGKGTVEITLRVDDHIAWTPATPHLYEGTVRLGEDVIATYFGIREVSAAKFNGQDFPYITLNRRPVYLNGTLDQSFNPKGYFTLPSEQDIIDEVKRLKELGLNFVRIHIKPEEPRKLYWCDKLGVLVQEDMGCFWGEPNERARNAWENETREIIARDFNHPSIFSWVIFNETWGLKSKIGENQRAYLPETQEYVRAMYNMVKELDATRLVEDNSACNDDHVITDINSWHFYINGYENVKDHVRRRAEGAYPTSPENYIGPNRCGDVPFMNSECGMVWGVDGSAGDSDIAWHYRYMLNEFRLQRKMCGFVFTEFHDVVNEWNGYYRLGNEKKDFGYGDYAPGMTIADLHSPDFLAIDAPPCRTLGSGDTVEIPLVYSCFNNTTRHSTLKVRWKLWRDALGVQETDAHGEFEFEAQGYGLTELVPVRVTMPSIAALSVFCVELIKDGHTLMRNFITFDVRGPIANAVAVRPADYTANTFALSWKALSQNKLNGASTGRVSYEVDISSLNGANGLEIVFEAGSKRVLKKDAGATDYAHSHDYMQGYRQDPGENPNSYFMTDEHEHPSAVEVAVNGESIGRFNLRNDPADSRGALSWHYQKTPRLLDEAGSYGYLCRAAVPTDVARRAIETGRLTLSLSVPEDAAGGLALYGRNAGHYPFDILVLAK